MIIRLPKTPQAKQWASSEPHSWPSSSTQSCYRSCSLQQPPQPGLPRTCQKRSHKVQGHLLLHNGRTPKCARRLLTKGQGGESGRICCCFRSVAKQEGLGDRKEHIQDPSGKEGLCACCVMTFESREKLGCWMLPGSTARLAVIALAARQSWQPGVSHTSHVKWGRAG